MPWRLNPFTGEIYLDKVSSTSPSTPSDLRSIAVDGGSASSIFFVEPSGPPSSDINLGLDGGGAATIFATNTRRLFYGGSAVTIYTAGAYRLISGGSATASITPGLSFQLNGGTVNG